MAKQVPSIGRQVHYSVWGAVGVFSSGIEESPDAVAEIEAVLICRPALVLAVYPEDVVSLHVFTESFDYKKINVPFAGDTPKAHHWHWPEYVAPKDE